MADRVAIVLLNWNGLQDTLECLSSLASLLYKAYQVIVVDNHSDEDLSLMVERYPEVTLIRNADNYGFCQGNNIGINRAAALGLEYCWILNNDTQVSPDCLGKLVAVLDNDEKIAAVTNRIDYYDDRTVSWFTGGIFENGLPTHRGYFQPLIEDNESFATEYLSGCSFLARTEVLKTLDGFDESYFCYVEDVDLSLRIRALGLKIAYAGDAIIWHKVSRSSGMESPAKLYYKHRNMLYFMKKFNKPIWSRVRWWLLSIRYVFSLLLKHRDARAAYYLGRGLFDALRGHRGRLLSL